MRKVFQAFWNEIDRFLDQALRFFFSLTVTFFIFSGLTSALFQRDPLVPGFAEAAHVMLVMCAFTGIVLFLGERVFGNNSNEDK